MITINAAQLKGAFGVNCDIIATHRTRPVSPPEWWLTGVFNLDEIGPVIAAQYRINAPACIKALRDQFSGGDLGALRDFAHWCSKQYPEDVKPG